MTRFRSLSFRQSVVPFVLAALALRAFVPAGFMPDGDGNLVFESQMCSTQEPGKVGAVELPGDSTPAHCDHCVLPMLGVALAQAPRVHEARPVSAVIDFTAQVLDHTPARPASARGPPSA